MPYFLILPLYIFLLIGTVVAGIVLLNIPKLKPYARYVFGAAIGSIPGFILANALLFLVAIGLVNVSMPKSFDQVRGIAAAVTLFICPFIVSFVGVVAGAILSIIVVRRKSAQHGS